jgi:hypothetical protein
MAGVVAATATGTLPAQTPTGAARERAPAAVRWGKWGAAALFVGLTAYGASLHNEANGDYRALIDWCQGGGGSCVLGADGTYTDPRSETLYQSSIDGDRAARAWLIAGQVALVGAVALFITELQYTHGPENIPFEPRLQVMPGPGGPRLGLRLAFPVAGP